MGKKRRILRNPKFASLKKLRKWTDLVAANNVQEEVNPEPLQEPEPIIEAPVLELAEKELAPPVEEVVPKVEAVKTAPARKKRVAPKPKAARAKAKKTSSKKSSTLSTR
tara:strand:- start:1289 stop:1615 length:327 start_codon:yes stop_codon:yes gene_type:complete